MIHEQLVSIGAYDPEGQAIAVANEQSRGTLVLRHFLYRGHILARYQQLDWVVLLEDNAVYLKMDIDYHRLNGLPPNSRLTEIRTSGLYPCLTGIERQFSAALMTDERSFVYRSPGYRSGPFG